MQRDVEALVAAGVPIRSIRGPAGGYHLDGRYQTRLTGVAAEEAHALAFLGLTGVAGELGLAGLLDTARTKVWAALTGEARDRAKRTTERFHLDPVRWYGTAEPAPFLGLLSEAVWHDRRIRVTHTRDNKTAERALDPLGLVLAVGEWYLVAHRQQSLRTYRVSRLTHVEILQEPARRPPGPSISPRAGLRHVPFETESWATTTMLGLGSQVEVLAPPRCGPAWQQRPKPRRPATEPTGCPDDGRSLRCRAAEGTAVRSAARKTAGHCDMDQPQVLLIN